jgi:hypothetical protein
MSNVAQKLGVRPGTAIAVAGMSARAVGELIGDLPAQSTLVERSDVVVDQLILVAASLSDLAGMLPGSWNRVAPGGRLWIWYRKGANRAKTQGGEVPLHRDTLQALLAEHGMDGVTLISVDDTWSSMRVKAL